MARTANAGFNAALERQVDRARAARRLSGHAGSSLESREFARLLDLLASRIAHLIRVYHLTDMVEDARQACAIAVLRALESYDPGQARFSTHVTWQIRGELQSLRHRMRLDQRRSARSAGITTVRLEALGEERGHAFEICDDRALDRVEAGASNAMSLSMLDELLEAIHAPEHERCIIRDQLLDRDPRACDRTYTSEQRRQITRRTYRNCAKVVAEMPEKMA
ncbi:sigma factor [Altererythrobacter sp. GH1-8]|uniref:sigma factor n=1 Tax=Altererythrobacter sp. GH1-8 TaxID=3349333 RepID=UPI00374CA18A